jgi:hypothetical protein
VTARDIALQRVYPWWNWYRRRLASEVEPHVVRDVFVSGFVAGAAYALRASAELGRLVPRLDELLYLLATDVSQHQYEAR